MHRPFDVCTVDPDGGQVLPMWTWLLNATYQEGIFEFMGKQVGVWKYEVSQSVNNEIIL